MMADACSLSRLASTENSIYYKNKLIFKWFYITVDVFGKSKNYQVSMFGKKT